MVNVYFIATLMILQGFLFLHASGSNNTTTTASAPTVKTTTVPTVGSTVKPTSQPSEKTCANLSVTVNISWVEVYDNKSSDEYKNTTGLFTEALTAFYSDSKKYDLVVVSAVTLMRKENKVHVEGTLCLVFKGSDDDFIEDVFIIKVNTGKLSVQLIVIKGSGGFVALGVTFKDWKARECETCDGAGGPFDIEGKCEVTTQGRSCKGLKTTKKSEDCEKYCSSSPAAITVSSLIMGIGIFLSFSFQ